MDIPSVAGIEELESHIQRLIEVPDTPLEVKLFDDVELQLTETTTPSLIPRLLPSLITLLTTTPHNPTPISSLTTRLLKPISYTSALTLTTPSSLISALTSPFPSTTLLALSIIRKASWTRVEAAQLAGEVELVEWLVRIWLGNPNVEVGEAAGRALMALFECECELGTENGARSRVSRGSDDVGERPFWKCFFEKGIVEVVMELCRFESMMDTSTITTTTTTTTATTTSLSALTPHQKTLAQARLFRLLPPLTTLNLTYLSTHPSTPNPISTPQTFHTVLSFALLRMIDKSDILLHITYVDFVRELLECLAAAGIGADGGLEGEVEVEAESMKEVFGEVVRGDEVVREMVGELKGRERERERGSGMNGVHNGGEVEGRELLGLLERLGLGN